ncbi:MAG: phosphodiester glycosidase family protein [Oscillospiraceae bacterium]|nr:phosphodiester glycosidase family protein [Oscillospiraceae bacterium]MBQ4017266.1 phosphodiester glycosidase family protein [Oscillospiraceae bacterium]
MSSSASTPKKRHPIGRFFAFLGVTLLCLVLTLLGLIWVLERGPSPTVTGMFTRSVRETSAIRWISNIFLSDEELENYKSVSTENTVTEAVNTSLIHIAEGTASLPPSESVQLIDIAEGTCKGKLLIVSDPKQVILGTSDEFVRQPGLLLTDMVAKYDGIAGINAGGFNDENGSGNGGIPQGLVITNGEIIWGDATTPYHMVGLDSDGILHVGAMSGNAAVEQGVQWAVSFITHDGLASSLIINGEVQQQNLGGGVNPRTALGQRADGALLLLVLDGRSINTLGATMEDVVNIMLEYGAVNAGNLDGGSSSVMVYDGEIINHCASVTGPRRIPTGFIVLKEGAAHG